MKIPLKFQIEHDLTLQPLPVKFYSGSALPLEFPDIPAKIADGRVVAVTVKVTNADGIEVTGQANVRGGTWYITFAASNFAAYGDVLKGVQVIATVQRPDDTTAEVKIGAVDLVIAAGAAGAQPGSPDSRYVVKGSVAYFPSRMVDGVQHFVKQEMVYDPEIGWGADWNGDYILSDEGEFIPFEEVGADE